MNEELWTEIDRIWRSVRKISAQRELAPDDGTIQGQIKTINLWCDALETRLWAVEDRISQLEAEHEGHQSA